MDVGLRIKELKKNFSCFGRGREEGFVGMEGEMKIDKN